MKVPPPLFSVVVELTPSSLATARVDVALPQSIGRTSSSRVCTRSVCALAQSNALVVSAQSEEVATAVADAAAAGVRVLGINSGLSLLQTAGAALSAYIGTDDRLRGIKAAEHMLAAGVSNPVSGSVTRILYSSSWGLADD